LWGAAWLGGLRGPAVRALKMSIGVFTDLLKLFLFLFFEAL